MATVKCTVEEVELENDRGGLTDGVRVTCSRCDAETESFGTGPASIRRCFILLREQCDEENFYTADEDD